MGAAMVQVSFNLGNAVGAYCGGLPITYGMGYNYPALVGTGFVIVGVLHRHVLPEIPQRKRGGVRKRHIAAQEEQKISYI